MARVSIIVACRNEDAYIEGFLHSVLSQTEPCEIVVADGMSEDQTRFILKKHAAAIRLIDNTRGTTSAGLNLALKACTGDIIVRMDAHTSFSPDYVATCLAVLAETGATNVGGPARTQAKGFWQQAIALGFHSPFFSGGARFHDPSYEGAVDTVPYGCWLRENLEALGGFDEALLRNQDDELNFRIHQGGGRIWQSPRIRSWYWPRRSLQALARQYYEYGFWKFAVMRKHGRPAHWRHLMPSLGMCGFLLLSLTSIVSVTARQVLLLAIASYFVAAIIASLARLTKLRNLIYVGVLPCVFITVHAAYAIGLLMAVLRNDKGRSVAKLA